MPSSNTANYTGQVYLDITDTTASANDVGQVVGDLAMSIDFDATGGDVSGTISNVVGETPGGDALAFDGELTTAAADGLGFASVVQTSEVVLPPPASGTIRTGAMLANFYGTLDQTEVAAGDGLDGDVLVFLGGAFFGDAAAAAAGPAAALDSFPGDASFVGSGTYYAEQ